MSTNEDHSKKLIDAYKAVQEKLDILTSGEVYFETDEVISLRQTAGKLAEEIQRECPEYFDNANQPDD